MRVNKSDTSIFIRPKLPVSHLLVEIAVKNEILFERSESISFQLFLLIQMAFKLEFQS